MFLAIYNEKIYFINLTKRGKMNKKRAQVSMEYLIIVGFVTFIIIGILGLAFIYSGSIKDSIKVNQITGFASKIISTSESIFYAGYPSKATIPVYLPEGVENISLSGDSLIIEFQTSTGKNKISFSSNVPITGLITTGQGIKKIRILAEQNNVNVSLA